MKKLPYGLILVSLTILCLACSPGTQESHHTTHSQTASQAHSPAVSTLEGEVLAVHDQLMARMGKLMALKRTTKERLGQDSIQSTRRKEQFETLLTQLEAADAAMTDWMHHYDRELTGKTEPEKLQYLEEEKKKIIQVQTLVENSIGRGHALLGKLPAAGKSFSHSAHQ